VPIFGIVHAHVKLSLSELFAGKLPDGRGSTASPSVHIKLPNDFFSLSKHKLEIWDLPVIYCFCLY
jgi:hypothetical protein